MSRIGKKVRKQRKELDEIKEIHSEGSKGVVGERKRKASDKRDDGVEKKKTKMEIEMGIKMESPEEKKIKWRSRSRVCENGFRGHETEPGDNIECRGFGGDRWARTTIHALYGSLKASIP